MILGIDTSSARTSVALVDGDRIVVERHADGAMSHGEVIAGLVESALASAFILPVQISAVAVGTGPGPFTGLRVGLAFARTFAWANSIPILGVCSLDALAADVALDDFVVVTDARRKEVYWARYIKGIRQGEPQVSKPEEVAATMVVGEGGFLYSSHFKQPGEPRFPRAAQVALLAQQAVAQQLPSPIDARYLRHPDVSV